MFRSGYVAILGVPNVGKSTLLNALLGEKLAIVTPKPQTTRHRILGILNRKKAQILFLDTPGIHAADRPLNEALVQTALRSMGDADVILHLVFPRKNLKPEDLEISRKAHESGKPYLVLINRIDEVEKDSLLPVIQIIQENLKPRAIIPVSARTGDGLDLLPPEIEKCLPEGPAYYPTDIYTEHDLRFLCAEIVREKAMLFLQQELPYQLAAVTEDYKDEPKLARIHVTLLVDKPSQKAIVVGAKGAMIKKIGQAARPDIEKLAGKQVFLQLFVRVQEDWTRDARQLKDLGLLGN